MTYRLMMVYRCGKVKVVGACTSERKALATCLHLPRLSANTDCAIVFLTDRFK